MRDGRDRLRHRTQTTTQHTCRHKVNTAQWSPSSAKSFSGTSPRRESIVEKSTMNSETLKEAPFGRLSVIYGLWTVVLQAIFSIVYIWFSFFSRGIGRECCQERIFQHWHHWHSTSFFRHFAVVLRWALPASPGGRAVGWLKSKSNIFCSWWRWMQSGDGLSSDMPYNQCLG